MLVLLFCVQILVRLDCFSQSITMEGENVLGETAHPWVKDNRASRDACIPGVQTILLNSGTQ